MKIMALIAQQLKCYEGGINQWAALFNMLEVVSHAMDYLNSSLYE